MAKLEEAKLELRSARTRKSNDFEVIHCEHDAHLQEERLRQLNGLSGSAGITRRQEEGRPRTVYAIVKLRDLNKTVDGLKICPPKDAIDALDPYSEEIEAYSNFKGYIVTCEVELDKLAEIWKDDNVLSLRAAEAVHLHLYHSIPAIQCDRKSVDDAARDDGNRFPGLNGADVVVGIVDFGCDFRHQNFRHSSGATRIRYFWDQTEPNDLTPIAGSTQPPMEYGYGREFSADMIDQALFSGEGSAYQTLGYTPPIAAHGTHVMDIAAGNGRELNLFNGKPDSVPAEPSTPGVAKGAQIIFVQLETFVDGGFLGNSCRLLEAVEYIFRRADTLGLPAVVNLSLSSTGGPHDGTTLIERRFEAMVKAKRGRAIVTSAGNSYLLRSHVRGDVGVVGKVIEWNTDSRFVDPDKNKNEMEIWYPGDTPLQVTLYPPSLDGKSLALGSIPLGETMEIFAGEKRWGRISHRPKNPRDPIRGDNQVDIRVTHIEDLQGPWRIEIASHNTQALVPFDAWIEQSERGLARFAGDTEPLCTLGSISCGNGTMTVGAFDTFEMASLAPPDEATSAGPIRKAANSWALAKRSKPELSAPGVNIVAARAQGGITALTGTSMAAPHVTGVIALLFQLAHVSGRGLLSFDQTCELLTDGSKLLAWLDLPNPDDPRGHDFRLGYGTVNAPLAMAKLLKDSSSAIILNLKLQPPSNGGRPALATYSGLFNYLCGNAMAVGTNGAQDVEILQTLSEMIQANDSFRMTIETL